MKVARPVLKERCPHVSGASTLIKNPEAIDPAKDVTMSPKQEYKALLHSLRRANGFNLLFVRCSPAEGKRTIQRLEKDLLDRQIEVLSLKEPIANLYELVDALSNKNQIDVLLIEGLEHSLYDYEKSRIWQDPKERYSYSEQGIPTVLASLNLDREKFYDRFKFSLVFLVPLFALKYLIRRAPDFFDWRSGMFEFAMNSKRLRQKSLQAIQERRLRENYSTLNGDEYRDRLFNVQALIDEPHQTNNQKANLLFEQARLLEIYGDLEGAIASHDRLLTIQPSNYNSWYNRGVNLRKLKRYEESITSFDEALAIQLEDANSWKNRGMALDNLGRYEEAIASYDRALAIRSEDANTWSHRGFTMDNLRRYEEALASYDRALAIQSEDANTWNNRGVALNYLRRYEEALASYDRSLTLQPEDSDAWYNKACCYALWGKADEAIENLQQAIAFDAECKEDAKTDSDFDGIRDDDRFQALASDFVNSERSL
jgi:tetratricopeptide (TPR) repeat protein